MLPYHTLLAVFARLLLQLPVSWSFYPAQRAGAHSGFCHLITQIHSTFMPGHAVYSPCHKDQGMEQAEIPGPRSLPGQWDQYHGVHCLTQLWEWECQQLPCIFNLLLSPARQREWHREQPGVWRQRAAKNAKPRLALLLSTSITKSKAEFKHRRDCDLWL